MRSNNTLNDDLLAGAQSSDSRENSDQIREALISREAVRRLAQLGGSEPDSETAPRRRTLPA